MATKSEKALDILHVAAAILGPLLSDLIRLAQAMQLAKMQAGEITEEQWAQSDIESEAALKKLETAISEAREPSDEDDVSP